VSDPVIEFIGLSKIYGGLRPLRIAELRVAAGDTVAVLGFDEPMAETFVNLATGATLPDSGDVRLFGRLTRAIETSTDWLTAIDRFGIISDRAVLLESMTPIQNLAMAFTLSVEPPPDDVRVRAEALAREVGLTEDCWTKPVGALDASGRVKLRLGRAIALDPAIVILEHASARLPRDEVAAAGEQMRRIAAARDVALIALTADEAFAKAVAARVLTLEPASGKLKEPRRGWFR
jgi:ABC-type polar amino acid transport system ATPase subunit